MLTLDAFISQLESRGLLLDRRSLDASLPYREALEQQGVPPSEAARWIKVQGNPTALLLPENRVIMPAAVKQLPSGGQDAGLMLQVDPTLLQTATFWIGDDRQHMAYRVDSGRLRTEYPGLQQRPIGEDETGMVQRLMQAAPAERDFVSRRFAARLEEVTDLPPLPEIVSRLLEIAADPNAGIDELAETVAKDAGLTAQLMRWARSPYYAYRGEISDLRDAMVHVLGFDLVMNMALGLAIINTLELPQEGLLGRRKLWRESVFMAAAVARLLRFVPHANRPRQGPAFLAGLLHNLGYLVLAHLFPPQYAQLREAVRLNPRTPRPLLERELLGIGQEQLASRLLRHWHLPEPICAAIEAQNDPGYLGEHAGYAHLLMITRHVLARLGYLGASPLARPALAMQELELDEEVMNNLALTIQEQAEQLMEMAQAV